MARRKRQPEVHHSEADERHLEWRYGRLCGLLAASEPGSDAEAVNEAIRAERRRLDAKGGPVDKRLAALEAFIAELGLADRADRFIAGLLAARARIDTRR